MKFRNIFHKRFLITGLLVVCSVVFLGFFSQSQKVNPLFQTFLVGIAFFLLVPMLYCKIVLREPLALLGWQRGKMWLGVLFSVLSVILALGIVLILSRFTVFREQYFISVTIQTNFLWFLMYELLLVPFIVLLYEVFFRGFIQMLWLRSFGILSVFVQAAIFLLLLFLSGDLSWQRVPALIFAPFAGLIVYASESLWYAIAATWLFFLLTDVFFLIVH